MKCVDGGRSTSLSKPWEVLRDSKLLLAKVEQVERGQMARRIRKVCLVPFSPIEEQCHSCARLCDGKGRRYNALCSDDELRVRV